MEMISLLKNMGNVDDGYLESLDDLIGNQVTLPGKDGIPLLVTDERKMLDHKGQPIGSHNTNPIIDSRI